MNDVLNVSHSKYLQG